MIKGRFEAHVKVPVAAPFLLLAVPVLYFLSLPETPAAAQFSNERPDTEIVAALTGGRVIVQVTHDKIILVAVNQPIEQGAPPPRLAQLNDTHVGIFLGASQWRILADPQPVRLDQHIPRITPQDPRYAPYGETGESDLESMGAAFLEQLHSLAGRLHDNLNFPPHQALLDIVIVGFGPQDYGPEVWTMQYRITQDDISSYAADFWQTRVLRPRFDQLYPPEKHAPHTIVQTGYPDDGRGPSIQELIESNDPRVEQLCSANPRFAKVVEFIRKGDSQKSETNDSIDFLRALIPLLFPQQSFFMATMDEQDGFNWVVPPEETVEKVRKNTKQGNQPPSLRSRPYPP